MAGKPSRSRPRRRLFGRGADYVALGLIAIAAIALAALALSGLSLRSGTNPSPTSRPASTVFDLPAETSTPTPTPAAPVSMSLLSDQNASTEGSWWAQSVAAALVPGVEASAELPAAAVGSDLLTTDELQDRVDATAALAGIVVVQSGTGDLVKGTDPAVVASGVQLLWQAVEDKGATPVVALVPPSDEYRAEVIELNGLLQTAAAASGYGVLDVYSPVAAADGSYGPSFSSDGTTPNAAGSQLLAQVAIEQLPQLIATK